MLLAIGLTFAVGCAKGPPPPSAQLLLPLALPVAWNPSPADRAAARAAGAALIDDSSSLDEQIAAIHSAEAFEKSDDLDVLAEDLRHSTFPDARDYRSASRELTRGFGTDPSVEARLEQAIADDPIKLAWKRRRDTWEIYWARTFNAASQPIGQSLYSGLTLAPLTIATSTAHYLASFSNDEALSTTDRQALVLRREYLAHNPDAEDAARVKRQIEGAEKKLAKTMQKRRLRAARAAREAGDDRVAIVEAERALEWGPSEDAEEIREAARERVARFEALHAKSLEAAAVLEPMDEDTHRLAVELLNGSATGTPLSDATLRSLRARREGPGSDEAQYLFALAQKESGFEDESWDTLMKLARRDPAKWPMVRHARHLIGDPWQHPYKAYRDMRAKKRDDEILWRLFDTQAKGVRYPNLPKPAAYTLQAPGIASALLTSPLRMIFGRWKKGPDFHRSSAMLGYRYLALEPDGEHDREVMEWLFEYEKSRDNHPAALRLADFLPDIDPEERDELAEQASAQALEAADRFRRPDRRQQVLHQTSTEFPDTESGTEAGKRVRWELEHMTEQRISITRSFLQENPRVAGPNGLGIQPELINGDLADGELHPTGVTLLGGRELRFHLLPASGDEEDEPVQIDKTVSKQRLSQLASVLDETTRRNQLIDEDDSLAPDADRDRYLERARLGLVDEPDMRPTAQSAYVYKSMRERYGVVRGRESVLPFDLVFQGSVTDFQLGAFPRWRKPKETPDAYLYR